MEQQYFIFNPGKDHEIGPMAPEKVREMFALGMIQKGATFWREGLRDWQPVEKLFSDMESVMAGVPSKTEKTDDEIAEQILTGELRSEDLLPNLLIGASVLGLIFFLFIYEVGADGADVVALHKLNTRLVGATASGFFLVFAELMKIRQRIQDFSGRTGEKTAGCETGGSLASHHASKVG